MNNLLYIKKHLYYETGDDDELDDELDDDADCFCD